MAKKVKQSMVSEVVKYGAVGGVSTVIDIALLNAIKSYLAWPVWLAVGLGFLAGTVNGYFMNSRWTFRYNTDGQEAKKLSQFALVSLVGLGLTELVVNSYTAFIGLDITLAGRTISETNVGKLIAVALIFVWNYGANKAWTFKPKALQ